MTDKEKTAPPVAPDDAARKQKPSTSVSPTSSTNAKPTDATGIMRRRRWSMWYFERHQDERAAPNVKAADAHAWLEPTDAPDVDICAEGQAIMRQRCRGLWCDACNKPVTVEDGVAEFDDEYGAFIVHEDCSNDALMLLSVDLSTLRREPEIMFDHVYPALREIALRLDRVRLAFVATRPFPFDHYAAFTMPPEPGPQVTT